MKSAATSSHAMSLRRQASKTPETDTFVRIESPAVPPERRELIPPQLTPRQLEVLSLLGEGLSNKLICRRLNIAPGTVKVHITGILRELGVASRLQAVVAARRCGLLAAPERSAGPAAGLYTIAAGCPASGTLHPRAVVF
jgi:DNA-binding NarL/FixJ family response regulator